MCANNPLLTYTIGTSSLPISETFKDLGVYVDSGLKFTGHVPAVHTRTLRLTSLIFRLLRSKDPSLYIKYYQSYVIPTGQVKYLKYLNVSNVSRNILKMFQVMEIFVLLKF